MENLLAQIQSQSIAEWIAFLFGFLYVVYAAKAKIICWIWGILSCGIWMVITFDKYSLYADAALQGFYVIMGFAGLYYWYVSRGSKSHFAGRISRVNLMLWIVGSLVISILLSEYLSAYTLAAATLVDSLTSVFSIVATIWLIQKKVENWVLWILVDLVYAGLYWDRGAVLFSLLYVVYTIFAVYGYNQWLKMMKET